MERYRSLDDMPRVHAARRPDAIVLSFEGRDTSYSAYNRRIDQVAHGLVAAGLKPGGHVTYLGKNTDLYFELMMGVIRAGGIMTPVNWRLAPPEIAEIIKDAELQLHFVGAEFLGIAQTAYAAAIAALPVFDMEGQGTRWPHFEAWRSAQSDAPFQRAVDPDEVALQIYTSGTTGRPKGVMLTHANFLSITARMKAAAELEWNRWSEADISLLAAPVANLGGTGYGITTMFHGARAVIAREFIPGEILDYIQRDGISKFALVPAALQIMLRDPRARATDFSRLKHLLYGSAPIPLDLLKEGIEVIGCGFAQAYGMTEVSGAIVVLGPEDHDIAGNPRMGSVGRPLPGVEIAILDRQGKRLGAGELGEIATRSTANMAGYWKLPEETAKTMDGEGWLRTGDAGFVDEDGYLFLRDRIKDVIITGGSNVYPAEVENALFSHPDVAEVGVVGLPDVKWGEAVTAFVVPRPGSTPDPAAIIAFARGLIAGYKVPKTIHFVPEMPRNAAGKILRRFLRERAM